MPPEAAVRRRRRPSNAEKQATAAAQAASVNYALRGKTFSCHRLYNGLRLRFGTDTEVGESDRNPRTRTATAFALNRYKAESAEEGYLEAEHNPAILAVLVERLSIFALQISCAEQGGSAVLSWLSKKHGKKLYCCFVDFKKAFDSVPRHELWSTWSELGIGGDILACLQS
ncbi:hypothetical protein MMC29_007666, partial [Sticta canariensis]|nr:hypothetical protein [Sticta canariensis]